MVVSRANTFFFEAGSAEQGSWGSFYENLVCTVLHVHCTIADKELWRDLHLLGGKWSLSFTATHPLALEGLCTRGFVLVTEKVGKEP